MNPYAVKVEGFTIIVLASSSAAAIVQMMFEGMRSISAAPYTP